MINTLWMAMMTSALVIATFAPAAAEELSYERLISAWENKSGEVITPAVQKAALRATAEDFLSKTSGARVREETRAGIAAAIGAAGLVAVSPDSVTARWSSGEVNLKWDSVEENAVVAKALQPELVSLHLEQFPRVTVVVKPVPPIDYLVEINGENVEATEKGFYRVSIGDVVVRVTRKRHSECLWKGTLKEGDQQVVNCKL
ncbi:hypothetical protein [Mesorhizobium sp. CA7]|uniref:hypothetical protein n=1 Tax=Mesorhizobium sp. CA7 TaxID=588501 RepID=UPI001CCA9348|nr:hypothetical protein [Mesorhizobium sp. CA7]MBZ9815748.1 hypothetical protein [Mesorhizobium sp. CA7]